MVPLCAIDVEETSKGADYPEQGAEHFSRKKSQAVKG